MLPKKFSALVLTFLTVSAYAVSSFTYPEAKRDDAVIDDYHGVKVADPYRWLEDPESEETKEFIEFQNNLTISFLHNCKIRDQLVKSITDIWNYTAFSSPVKAGSRYFYAMNTGLQDQGVLYVQETLTAEPRIIIDPNTFASDGTKALNQVGVSRNGECLAYGVSEHGSDWITVKFRNVTTGEDYPETLEYVKFTTLKWTHDHKGIFYSRFPTTIGKADGANIRQSYNQKLYYHYLGTNQTEDVLCAEYPEHPAWMTDVKVSDCGNYVIVYVRDVPSRKVIYMYILDLRSLPYGIKGILPVLHSVKDLQWDYEYITNEGSVFTFRTNAAAPKYHLLNVDINNPSEGNWTELVGEHEKDVLMAAYGADGNKLIILYLSDGKSILRVHDLHSGKFLYTLLNGAVSVGEIFAKKNYNEVFFKYSSFLEPGTVYRVDIDKTPTKLEVLKKSTPPAFNPSEYEVNRVFYSSKDGAKIPMYIIYHKNVTQNGSNLCLLYGYGGHGVSILPSFSSKYIVFMRDLGGIVAIANIRGGGEYGKNWHKDGSLLKKQNSFDDFQYAAKYLQDNNYTTSKKLAIEGASNGGLLIGASINQNPGLFGAAIAHVGTMDMLRYPKFTGGYFWKAEYGDPENKTEFENLYKYSPLHNVKVPPGDVQYPATFLLTGDHDDRVVPSHSLKFIAELQYKLRNSSKQTNPLLIYVDAKSGHRGAMTTEKQVGQLADVFCFITETIDQE